MNAFESDFEVEVGQYYLEEDDSLPADAAWAEELRKLSFEKLLQNLQAETDHPMKVFVQRAFDRNGDINHNNALIRNKKYDQGWSAGATHVIVVAEFPSWSDENKFLSEAALEAIELQKAEVAEEERKLKIARRAELLRELDQLDSDLDQLDSNLAE